MEISTKRKRIIEIIAVLAIVTVVSLVGTYALSNYTITPDHSLPREWIPEAGTVFIGNKLEVYQVYAYRIKGRQISKGDERRVIKIGYIIPVSAVEGNKANGANGAIKDSDGQPDK